MKSLLATFLFIILCMINCSTISDNIKEAAKSVVIVRSHRCLEEDEYAHGSGIVIANNGYIVTNLHIIKDFDDFVVIYKIDTLIPTIVAVDSEEDLLLLQVKKDIPSINIRNSNTVSLGEDAFAIGYPMNLGIVLSSGKVSGLKNKYYLTGEYSNINYLMSDVVTNPGNSGGPLIDKRGRLIGMNKALYTYTGFYMGYSFAIPSNTIVKFCKRYIK